MILETEEKAGERRERGNQVKQITTSMVLILTQKLLSNKYMKTSL